MSNDNQKNVFGEPLELCSNKPLTGWFRDGCCNTDKNDNTRVKYLYNQLQKLPKKLNQLNVINLSNKLYQKGYSGLDIMRLIENNLKIDDLKKYTLLCTFSKIKKEFRNEKIIIYFIIVFTFFRSDHNLENISFI